MSDFGHDPALRERLGKIEGVQQLAIDRDSGEVWLVLRADVDPKTVEDAAREALGGLPLQIVAVYRPERRDRQRVKFVEIQRATAPDKQVVFTVTLEWAGSEYSGNATGEKGVAIELRTAATASLTAVAALVPHEVKVRLAGVKQVRAFDADLVVVSLYRPDDEPHSLVGAVVAGDDPQRAAALSVLSALNRLLGNYLALP